MLKKEIFEENAILRCIVLHLILHMYTYNFNF